MRQTKAYVLKPAYDSNKVKFILNIDYLWYYELYKDAIHKVCFMDTSGTHMFIQDEHPHYLNEFFEKVTVIVNDEGIINSIQ